MPPMSEENAGVVALLKTLQCWDETMSEENAGDTVIALLESLQLPTLSPERIPTIRAAYAAARAAGVESIPSFGGDFDVKSDAGDALRALHELKPLPPTPEWRAAVERAEDTLRHQGVALVVLPSGEVVRIRNPVATASRAELAAELAEARQHIRDLEALRREDVP